MANWKKDVKLRQCISNDFSSYLNKGYRSIGKLIRYYKFPYFLIYFLSLFLYEWQQIVLCYCLSTEALKN